MNEGSYLWTNSNKMDLTVLRELRKGKGIRQTDLAKSVGITQTYLSLIESNKRKASVEVIENLCHELDCELSIIPNGSSKWIIDVPKN